MKWFHWTGLMIALLLCLSFFFPSYFPLSLFFGIGEEDWSFSVEGLVDNQYDVTYKELLGMPTTTVEAKLYCYPNNLIPVQEGNWTGVRLGFLLERAGLGEDVIELAFYASDGFTADISMEDASRPDVIIAYELNGRPIKGRQGYPKNRLVIPGAWGFKWIAWVEKIEAVDYDFEASYGEMEEEPVDVPLGTTALKESIMNFFPPIVSFDILFRIMPTTLILHKPVRKPTF